MLEMDVIRQRTDDGLDVEFRKQMILNIIEPTDEADVSFMARILN
jgi:hypothetical protein